MNIPVTKGPLFNPQDLERQLVARENAGDVDGMTDLFESDAMIELNDGMNDGQLLRGIEAIREFFEKLQVTGIGPEGRHFRMRAENGADFWRSCAHFHPQHQWRYYIRGSPVPA